MSAFSPTEMQRYARHFTVPEIGLTGQAKLKATSVLLIGAGGIGCPAALYLAACGMGRIGIVDHDTIELSNLQRQILYQTAECGQKKAVIAGEKMTGLNPHIQCDVHPVKLTQDNADRLLAQYDIIVDGSDNYATRYLVNDTCVALKKPLFLPAFSSSPANWDCFVVKICPAIVVFTPSHPLLMRHPIVQKPVS